MLIIEKSWFRVPSFSARTDGEVFKFLWRTAMFLLLSATGHTQQLLTFNVGGRNYSAEITWVVKHNNIEFKTKSAHTLDFSKAGAFDLAVFFNFKNDSVPAGGDIVWGLQFSQNGNLINPPGGEKRSRSKSQFQRFNISGVGSSAINITPTVWQKSGAGRFDVLRQGGTFALNFNFTDSNPAPVVSETAGPAGTPEAGSQPAKPANNGQPASPVAETPPPSKAETDYAAAKNVTDTIQRTRALIDFVDKYSTTQPRSELVAKAVKDIPLGVSIPSIRGEGTYAYTLDYPVNLYIDSAKVKGWRWDLSQTPSGKYQLVLTDLKDSVHAFPLVDRGKNAPFNLPKDLSPFDKIKVELIGESSDSFRLRVSGGTPPFIVFLSKNGFPVERYIIERTNTIQSFSKDDCERCETGSYTLEVYTNDFSTLLVRFEKAISIRKINYLLALLFCIVGIPVAYFFFKIIRRLWQWLVYQKTLRDIHVWEEREIREAERRKKK